jgi:hypothetical protein
MPQKKKPRRGSSFHDEAGTPRRAARLIDSRFGMQRIAPGIVAKSRPHNGDVMRSKY